jgi:hypothetical protein
MAAQPRHLRVVLQSESDALVCAAQLLRLVLELSTQRRQRRRDARHGRQVRRHLGQLRTGSTA